MTDKSWTRRQRDQTKRFTKTTLPSKACVTCGRPFAWRKKWARVWDEVKYCSDRCRAAKLRSDGANKSAVRLDVIDRPD
jgi:hypothetical protein